MTRRPILMHSMLTSWCPCYRNVWPPSLQLKQQRFEDPLKSSITWFSEREEDRQQLLLKTQQRERESRRRQEFLEEQVVQQNRWLYTCLWKERMLWPKRKKGNTNVKIITRDSFNLHVMHVTEEGERCASWNICYITGNVSRHAGKMPLTQLYLIYSLFIIF